MINPQSSPTQVGVKGETHSAHSWVRRRSRIDSTRGYANPNVHDTPDSLILPNHSFNRNPGLLTTDFGNTSHFLISILQYHANIL